MKGGLDETPSGNSRGGHPKTFTDMALALIGSGRARQFLGVSSIDRPTTFDNAP
jgi:hypothetical protein